MRRPQAPYRLTARQCRPGPQQPLLVVADHRSTRDPSDRLQHRPRIRSAANQIADELAKQCHKVHIIHRSGKLGLGTAYVAGFKLALTLPTDCIMTMDADFSHHPRYIPSLIAQTRVYDLSIGSRYVDGGGTVNCNLRRRFLSRMGNTVARLFLGLQASDCTAGFRCYRRQVLEAIDLDSIFSSGYSFLVEMLYKCQQLGYHVGEVPIIFENRRQGASKISQSEVWKAAYTVLRLNWERISGSAHP